MKAPALNLQAVPPLLIALILALATLALYLPVCTHEFIYYDDPVYVSNNNIVQAGWTWAGIKWAFGSWAASNWHPLTWLSLMTDCQIFGLKPGALHLVNLLFHILNTILLFRLCLLMTNAIWPSAVVAAFFAWHPQHVESVAWITERKDVLSMFFGLLALITYVNFSRNKTKPGVDGSIARRNYFLTLLFLALGLMAKPMLVTLPFVFLLLDYWPLCRFPDNKIEPRNLVMLIREKIPFFLLAAVFCVVTYLAQHNEAVMSLQQRPLEIRLENAVLAYMSYVFKTIWPVNLGIIYPLRDHLNAGEVVLAGTFLLLVTIYAWQSRHRHPCILMGWLWFVGTLVPMIGIVQVGLQSMADRYTYLPSIGFLLALVFATRDMAIRVEFLNWPIRIATVLALIACFLLTGHQLRYWKNTKTLFNHSLAVTGNNAQAHMILGTAYEREGLENLALFHYRAALKLEPSTSILMLDGTKRPLAAHVSLILADDAEQHGDWTNAIAYYREVLHVDPSLAGAHSHIAYLLYQSGNIQKAISHCETAIQLAPQDPLTHENLGTMFLDTGRFKDAMRQYQEAAQLQPDNPKPVYLMAKALLRSGQSSTAIMEFRHALKLDASDCPSLAALARVLASDTTRTNRNGNEALKLARKANQLTGETQPYILDTLAMAYAETGLYPEAQQTVNQAIALATKSQPDLVSGMKQRQQLYLADLPCRESFTNTLPNPP